MLSIYKFIKHIIDITTKDIPTLILRIIRYLGQKSMVNNCEFYQGKNILFLKNILLYTITSKTNNFMYIFIFS